jgi:hypothetical protein
MLIQKMQRLLASLWTTVVTGGEVVLEIDLQLSMLGATLAQKSDEMCLSSASFWTSS